MSMALVHQLASDDSPATRKILDNVIFLLVPSANPDGEIAAFLESTYEAAATLGGWDIDALAAETATNNR